MKRTLTALLLIIAAVFTAPYAGAGLAADTGANSGAAADLPSGWARAEVAKALSVGLVPEELRGDYQAAMTRAEFMKMDVLFLASLYNADVDDLLYLYGLSFEFPADGRPVYQVNVFTDTNDFYVNMAYALGLAHGRGNGTFGPNDPVTRQEAAHLLINTYFKYGGGIKHGPGMLDFDKLKDSASVADWARNDAAYMFEWGVLTGIGDDLYDPAGSLTREQAIAAFLRYCDRAPIAKYPTSPGSVCPVKYDALLSDIKSQLMYTPVAQYDTPLCTVLFGSRTGVPHGPYPSLWIVWKEGGRREVLRNLPQDTPLNNNYDISDMKLSDDQAKLIFTRRYEGRSIRCEVDLKTAALTAIG